MTSKHYSVDTPNLSIDGTFTIWMKDGRHFTYRVSTVKRGALQGKRIISLLIGPDNVNDYTPWGFVFESPDEKGCYVAVWKRYQTEAYRKHKMLVEGRAQEHVQEVLQSGRCRRCGRTLTTVESIKAGLGPVCQGRSEQ